MSAGHRQPAPPCCTGSRPPQLYRDEKQKCPRDTGMNRGCLGQLVPGSSFRLVPAAFPSRSWPECRLVPAAAPEPPTGLYRQPSLGLYRQPPPASLPACTGSRPRAARRLVPAAAHGACTGSRPRPACRPVPAAVPGPPAGLYRQLPLGRPLACTGSHPWAACWTVPAAAPGFVFLYVSCYFLLSAETPGCRVCGNLQGRLYPWSLNAINP